MNTKIWVVLLVVCIIIVTGVTCITVLGNKKGVTNIVENPLEGVVLEIKENTVSNTGLTLIIKNVASNNYAWGSAYLVEKAISSSWEPVPDILDGNYAWTSELRILQGHSITELDIDWGWLHGELSPGHYRVIKDFAYMMSEYTNGNYYPIPVEFIID
jgi:hypothetical protein